MTKKAQIKKEAPQTDERENLAGDKKTKVFVVRLDLHLPRLIVKNDLDHVVKSFQALPLSLSFIFANYPTVESVLLAIQEDPILAQSERYEHMMEYAIFGLSTWGIPKLPRDNFNSLFYGIITTEWEGNTVETHGDEQRSQFKTILGRISISHKEVR